VHNFLQKLAHDKEEIEKTCFRDPDAQDLQIFDGDHMMKLLCDGGRACLYKWEQKHPLAVIALVYNLLNGCSMRTGLEIGVDCALQLSGNGIRSWIQDMEFWLPAPQIAEADASAAERDAHLESSALASDMVHEVPGPSASGEGKSTCPLAASGGSRDSEEEDKEHMLLGLTTVMRARATRTLTWTNVEGVSSAHDVHVACIASTPTLDDSVLSHDATLAHDAGEPPSRKI